jgi:hypothetical protein
MHEKEPQNHASSGHAITLLPRAPVRRISSWCYMHYAARGARARAEEEMRAHAGCRRTEAIKGSCRAHLKQALIEERVAGLAA